MQPSSKHDGLQVLRAFAALLVLVQHAYFFSGQVVGDDVIEFRRLSLGTLGVLVFFTISGAVMAIATTSDRPATFAIGRLARIYPAYLVSLLVSAIALSLFGTAPQLSWDISLLLLPSGTLNDSFKVPYWTLIYEMFFYGLLWVAALFAIPHRVRVWLSVIWVAAIVSAAALGHRVPNGSPNLVQIILAPMNICLALGYAIGSATVLKDARPVAAISVIAVIGSYLGAFPTLSIMFVTFCGGVVYLAIALDRMRWPAPVVRLGDLSYGLYLMHLPFVFLVHMWASAHHWSFTEALLATLVVGGAVGLTYGYFEHRLYISVVRPWSRKIGSRPATQSAHLA